MAQKTITRKKSIYDLVGDLPDAFYQDIEEAIQYEYNEMIEEAGIDEEDIVENSDEIKLTISITYKTKGKKNA